jgi:hypothetical protein
MDTFFFLLEQRYMHITEQKNSKIFNDLNLTEFCFCDIFFTII